MVKVASSVVQIDASRSVAINSHNTQAVTTISGRVHFNGSSTKDSLLSITDVAVRANPPKFRVGPKGKTEIASIEATHVTIGGPGANATVLPPSESKLELFSSSITVGSEGWFCSDDLIDLRNRSLTHVNFSFVFFVASEVSLTGKSVVVDAMETLVVGEQADEVNIGGEEVGKVNLQGEAVSLSGMWYSRRCCTPTF